MRPTDISGSTRHSLPRFFALMYLQPNHLWYDPMYRELVMPRPRIDIDDETHQRVEEYAHQKGLRMPRAYAELIVKGLDAEEVSA